MKQTGFRLNQVIPLSFKSAISSPEHVVSAFLLKHPMAKEVADKDPAAVLSLAEKIRKKITKKFGEEKIQFDLKAFIGIGEK